MAYRQLPVTELVSEIDFEDPQRDCDGWRSTVEVCLLA